MGSWLGIQVLRGRPLSGFRLSFIVLLILIIAGCPWESDNPPANNPPVADAGPDQTVDTGAVVQLDGTNSTDSDGNTISYRWAFVSVPSGSATTLSDATSPMPTFTVDVPGDYLISLQVNDGFVDSSPDQVVISVTNSAPVADAGPDQTADPGSLVQLDGSGSSDVDGNPLTYAWTITSQPGSSNSALDNEFIVDPSFVVDVPGDYLIELIVNDGFIESDPDTTLVSATNSRPMANAGPDQTATEGETVTVDGSASSDADGNPLSYVWSIISSPSGSTTGIDNADQAVASFTADAAGIFVIQLVVNDGFLDSEPATASVTVEVAPPVVTDTDGDGLTDAEEAALGTNPNNPDSDNDGLTDGEEVNTTATDPLDADSDGDGLGDGQEVNTTGTDPNDVDTDGDGIDDKTEVDSGTDPNDPGDFPSTGGLPPDPATIASPMKSGEVTTIKASTEFLYTGANPIQTGVNPDDIEARRAAVIRGKVMDAAGAPLPGVTITILDHPEFGQTLSREDGMFDMVVNGGGRIVVNYELDGYLSIQRGVETPWNNWGYAPDVVMIQLDPNANAIDLMSTEAFQVARGSMQTDADGTRQATVLFPQGTTAEMLMPDGTRQSLSSLTVRATEYTVGEMGRERMPADLPPTTAYTYAVELSADEALAAGADRINFSNPVVVYVDNFIGFPSGGAVPAGVYDRNLGRWIAVPDGVVIDIVGEASGAAEIDIDGDGQADEPSMLDDRFGITAAELTELASNYNVGDSLWRVPVQHFSPFDFNWFGWPPKRPPYERPLLGERNPFPKNDPCEEAGSIIECQRRVLRENVELSGLPFDLHYRSDRSVSGSNITFTVSPSEGLSPDITSITAELLVNGRVLRQDFPLEAGLTGTFDVPTTDIYGREMQGAFSARLRIQYGYRTLYQSPGVAEAGLGGSQAIETLTRRFSVPTGADFTVESPGRITVNGTVQREYLLSSLAASDARLQTTGGWTIGVHHQYDSTDRTMYLGNGEKLSEANAISNLVFNQFTPNFSFTRYYRQIQAASDGSVFGVGRGIGAESGIVGIYGFDADGNPSTTRLDGEPGSLTADWFVSQIALGPDEERIYYLGFDGSPSTGTRQLGYVTLDDERVVLINDLSVEFTGMAFDALGGLYISAADGHIYYINSSAIADDVVVSADLTIVAGTGRGEPTSSGFIARSGEDGAPALESDINPRAIEMGPDGSLYFNGLSSGSGRVRKITAGGIVETVLGGGDLDPRDPTSDPLSVRLISVSRIRVDDENRLFIANGGNLYQFDGESLSVLAGSSTGQGSGGATFAGTDAHAPNFSSFPSFALRPNGDIAIVLPSSSSDRGAIWLLAPKLPGFDGLSQFVASTDGSRVYEFSPAGRHMKTLDSVSGLSIFEFFYSNNGLLERIVDRQGRTLIVERGPSGEPVAIISPAGLRNELVVGASGWLDQFTNADNDTWQMEYTPDAQLLSSLTTPRNELYQYEYTSIGKLATEIDPLNGTLELSTSHDAAEGIRTVFKTLRDGAQDVYRWELNDVGNLLQTNTVQGFGTTTIEILENETTITNYADGTSQETTTRADPRFGLQSPLLTTIVETPSGRRLRSRTLRSVLLQEPENFLSVSSLTENTRVGSREFEVEIDSTARTKSMSLPSGLLIGEAYNEDWQITELSRPGLAPINYSYDGTGLLIRAAQSEQSLNLSYNSDLRPNTVTDAGGLEMSYEYDGAGRRIRTILPSGAAYGMTYDGDGNNTGIIMPEGGLHAFVFTEVGELASYTTPLSNATSYEYDLGRKRTRTEHPSGRIENIGYDTDERLATIAYPAAEIQFTYQPDSGLAESLTRLPAGGGVAQAMSWSYDGFLTESMSLSGQTSGEFSYDYDADLQLSSIRLDAEPPIEFVYGADGSFSRIGPFAINRSPLTGLPATTNDGTLTLQYTHDQSGRLIGRSYSVAGTEVYSNVIDYDASGRISTRTETVGGTTREFGYTHTPDEALAAVTVDGSVVDDFEYSSNGNRVLHNGMPATYDAADRVTSVGATNYTHNDDGQMTSRGTDEFIWSARGELLEATVDGQTVSYNYDGMGRVTARTIGGEKTQYLYGNPLSPVRLTHSRTSDGILTTYVYDDFGKLLGLIRGGSLFYVAVDQLGSPRVVTDETGNVVKTIEYDEWGNLLSDSDPGFELVIGFAGGIADSASRLVHFGFRVYDPASGRWMTADPIRFDGGGNLYRYAANNPIQYRDPFGLFCIGGEFYKRVGGGGQVCYKDGKASACAEVGFGQGGGLKLQPFADPKDGELFVQGEVGVEIGPYSLGHSLKLTNCGELGGIALRPDAKASGPGFEIGLGEEGELTGTDGLLGSKGIIDDLRDIAKGNTKPQAVAKGSAGFCVSNK